MKETKQKRNQMELTKQKRQRLGGMQKQKADDMGKKREKINRIFAEIREENVVIKF